MFKFVTPALALAVLAQAVFAGPAGIAVRMQTPEAIASACKLAPGFQSAGLWQQEERDDDIYVRTVVADARSASSVRAAVARFKAELQDRAMAEALSKLKFIPGRLTFAGCASYAAVDGASDGDEMFPPIRLR